ncbi:class E sortase [Candidatus Saccharibacteria bacterium]|nr:class E sortase [Candidatus Saccharibacteria bacterium]
MEFEKGGQTSGEKQRQTAAEIMRRKALQSYVDEDEWKKYHTAWQSYYQKYYGDFYLKAAKEYVARERAKDAERNGATGAQMRGVARTAGRARNVEEPRTTIVSKPEKREETFKERIRKRASEQAKRAERRRKVTPLIIGGVVMLLILFLQYNRLIFAPIFAYLSPGNVPKNEITAVDPTVTLTKVSAENKLIIPKLNIEVPIEFGVEYTDVMEAMNHGVAHYRISGASAFPGEIGNFVITGHSAGDIYSSNPYKFIFSGLERLEEGDLIYVHYNETRYTYRVTGKEVIEPTEVSKLVYPTEKPVMTLITCYPLGTSRQRLLVSAEQISPSYVGAATETEVVSEETEMPKNEKTLFERLFGL